MNADNTPESRPDGGYAGWVAFHHRDYRYYWFARFLGVLAIDMEITVVLWQVFELTGSYLDLGLVGAAQFLPFFLLFLVAGLAADRLPRKHILTGCVLLQTLGSILLFVFTLIDGATFGLIFGVLILMGTARSFQSPAQQAIVPVLVPKEHFSNAVAWTSTGFTTGRIIGPAIAGILIGVSEKIGVGVELAYGVVVALFIASALFTLLIKAPLQILSKERASVKTILAGFRFILPRQIVLGSISLDLFAVLLGAFNALIVVYAQEILNVGSEGYGILRSMPAFGAVICAIYLTQRPIRHNIGVKLLVTVALFGVSIIVFGLSTSFWVSVVALFVMGAADMISVFIRNNLVQLVTPDDVRGRVNAVSAVFVGASNELGDTRAGLSAALFGPVPAVVVGGICTVIVAVSFAYLLPDLRRVRNLDPDELIEKYRDLPD
ncbi:MAG: MFS transporter [Proteobacteria bacterium]|nr:MFS transporter [Pseudomonadota bacterium]